MSKFIQLHLLTSFPPANLNRDQLGRPKSAKMGGTDRLRISSQSLKRHWRTSDLFQDALSEHLGTRTKRLGIQVYDQLLSQGIKAKSAEQWAQTIASVFGKLKKPGKDKKEDTEQERHKKLLEGLEIEQLVHISPAEAQAIEQLVTTLASEQRAPEAGELALLRKQAQAVDIALFGRMLASKPEFNVEAACQVAHAISVHPVVVEDDYFTAVDDLNSNDEDTGAAHIGEAGFAAALFYLYICIDRAQLIDNLGGDTDLANRALRALTETAVKVAPKGKQNSFASRSYASYALAEKGDQQPRSLSVAFLKALIPGLHQDLGLQAVQSLQTHRDNINQVYELADDLACCEFNALTGEGRLQDVLDFISA